MFLQCVTTIFFFASLNQAQPPPCAPPEVAFLNTVKDALRTAHDFCSTGNVRIENYGTDHISGSPINAGSNENHRLNRHTVCYDAIDFQKKIYVDAYLNSNDVCKGSYVNDEARLEINGFSKTCGCDESGHIIPNDLGGNGDIGNLFPQNRNLNAGLWNAVCREVINFLGPAPFGADRDRTVTFKIAFLYDDPAFPYRPTSYYYHFLYSDQEKTRSVYGFFENESHYNAQLERCAFGQDESLYYVSTVDKLFYARRSWRVNPVIPHTYGPPTHSQCTTSPDT